MTRYYNEINNLCLDKSNPPPILNHRMEDLFEWCKCWNLNILSRLSTKGAYYFVCNRNILTSLSDGWNIPKYLNYNIGAYISTDPYTINSDLQVNIIYTVGLV